MHGVNKLYTDNGTQVYLCVAEVPQICTACGLQMQGDWIAHLPEEPWQHLVHVVNRLNDPSFTLPIASETRSPSVRHEMFDGRPGYLRTSLGQVLDEAGSEGFLLVGYVPITQDLWVAVFVEEGGP